MELYAAPGAAPYIRFVPGRAARESKFACGIVAFCIGAWGWPIPAAGSSPGRRCAYCIAVSTMESR
jgi:hypothetical protein